MVISAVFADHQTDLNSLRNAERAFAAQSRATSTRHAFLATFSADGVVFPGEKVNALAHWSKQPETADWLDWYPATADVARSGELGFTFGPYTYKAERTDTATARHGFFFSVWKRVGGEWKVWIDMGGSAPVEESDSGSLATTIAEGDMAVNRSAGSLLNAERTCIAAINSNGAVALEDFLAKAVVLCRPKVKPALTATDALAAVVARGEKVRYRISQSRLSRSGEFGVVLGTADIDLSLGSQPEHQQGNYVRVWKKLDGKWQIVGDVLLGFPISTKK